MNEFIYSTILFLLASYASIILSETTDLGTILKILSVLIAGVLVAFRLNLKRAGKNKIVDLLIKALAFFSLSLFLMLLVISTGGFVSPFFIVVYIATLALAFLSSFPIAMAFLVSCFISVFTNSYLSSDSKTLFFDPAVLIIQIASVAGIVPFSYFVASRYHIRGKVADYLFAELSYSKQEEDTILENIDEAVITIDRQFLVARMNKTAEDITGFKNDQVVGKDFFETFKFFDAQKNPIDKDRFPIQDIISKQSGFRESNLLLKKSDGLLSDVDFKLSSIIGSEGKIEAFLFVFSEKKENSSVNKSDESVLLETFGKFSNLIGVVNSGIEKIEGSNLQDVMQTLPTLNKDSKRMFHAYTNLEILYKLATGQTPGLLSDVDVGDMVRSVIENTQDLAKQYQVALINSTPYSPPLPIKTNKLVFQEAIFKIAELGIFIAARSQDKLLIISTGSSADNIFVFIKASCFDNFPWGREKELLNPFFGTLSTSPELSEASGLEGYIAESLMSEKKIKGNISMSKFEDGIHAPQILFTITLPFLNAK